MLRIMQPLMRSFSVITSSSTIMGKLAKVETKGAANGFKPAFIWQFTQARSLPA
jgi:hypothetical protein